MKSSKLIMGCLATLGLTAGASSVHAEVDRDAIAERLKPAGNLCLQGEDCGTAAAREAEGDAPANGIDGGSIYGNVCAACHESGAAGAPIRGDEGGWADRIDKGWDELLANSINGIGAMPARGGNPNLSDEEVAASTAYLLEPVMDVPEVGDEEVADEAPAADEEPAADEAPAEDAAADEEAVTEEGPVEEEAEAAAVAAEEAVEDEAVEEAATEEAAPVDDEPAWADIDGEAIYNQACMACHMTGAAGAPIRGNEGHWAERMEKGMETLYENSITGIGAMPPKGGHANLSDDEVRAATDYLVEPTR
ncbi:c-type cytochrome [Halomonas chromatireducens]|uniref:Cytochrome c-555 n=1 Tax=Halomonas chromatireducens TaxID=507626 RepID=A0A0X8HBN3_9GAMM|nr:c-type cytochrome [Halomonas chromatireducens]AMC99509.1 Cytochrome c-555 [Halomonas chromatireducens]